METLKEQLIRHEGIRAYPYKDSVGKLTIGVGRNLDDVGIFRDEALMMLENDLQRVFEDLDYAFHSWWRSMNEVRQNVLANMCFNLGIIRLKGFIKALTAMRGSNWDTAASEMLDSKWAKQVGKRATELAEQMRTGVV